MHGIFHRLAAFGAVALLGLASAANAQNVVQTFTYTGADQTFTVPANVTSINVYLWGAGGYGPGSFSGLGGGGAFVSGSLAVTPGSVFTLLVGGAGGISSGGFGGGGSGVGGGGGRSALQQSGASGDLVDAGGGGGSGGGLSGVGGAGGAGGVTQGRSGQNVFGLVDSGGKGGTQSAGGAGGLGNFDFGGNGRFNGSPGGQYTGGKGGSDGSANRPFGGGGGGGYYGGGGGGFGYEGIQREYGGGGGGSSYLGPLTNITDADGSGFTPGGANNPYYLAGVGVGGTNNGSKGGNGEIVFVYPSAVPEPGSVALLVGMATGGAGVLRRRRK